MKKNFIKAVSSLLILSMLSGCAGNAPEKSDVSEGTTTQEITSAEISEETTSAPEETEAPAETTEQEEIDFSSLSEEEIYDLMVKRSLITTGDMTRMANVFDRAAKGEKITAAYIGGSITEGYSDNITLKTEEKWVTMSTEWLSEQFPDADISYVNAGLSGTPSVLGNVRDVLVSDPDIVFVEFAVNDGMEDIYKNAYESLVRTLLTQDKDVAVVLLFTIVENGHTCQPHMTQIGENYNLPMISLPDSMWVEIKEGRMAWSDYSADQSHPNVEGSKMIRDFVINYFEKVMEVYSDKIGAVDKNLPDPIFSGDYANMHFLDNTNLTAEVSGFAPNDNGHHWFKDGWMYRGDEGASLKFDINCKKLAMVMKVNNSKMFGSAEIYVDGELAATINSNKSDGWNNPVAEYIIDGDEAAAHTVEIVVPEGEKCYFGIFGFGYCE